MRQNTFGNAAGIYEPDRTPVKRGYVGKIGRFRNGGASRGVVGMETFSPRMARRDARHNIYRRRLAIGGPPLPSLLTAYKQPRRTAKGVKRLALAAAALACLLVCTACTCGLARNSADTVEATSISAQSQATATPIEHARTDTGADIDTNAATKTDGIGNAEAANHIRGGAAVRYTAAGLCCCVVVALLASAGIALADMRASLAEDAPEDTSPAGNSATRKPTARAGCGGRRPRTRFWCTPAPCRGARGRSGRLRRQTARRA